MHSVLFLRTPNAIPSLFLSHIFIGVSVKTNYLIIYQISFYDTWLFDSKRGVFCVSYISFVFSSFFSRLNMKLFSGLFSLNNSQKILFHFLISPRARDDCQCNSNKLMTSLYTDLFDSTYKHMVTKIKYRILSKGIFSFYENRKKK